MGKKNNLSTGANGAANAMWIYGIHAVDAVLKNPRRKILKIMLTRDSEILVEDKKLLPKLQIVEKDVFASMFGNAIHQGCAVLVEHLPECALEDLVADESDNRPFVFLDQVQDPQNIGSILRAAAVFGARAIAMTDKNSPKISSAIAKTASGALEIIPFVRVVNMIQAINYLKNKGFWCIGLDERADKYLHEIPMKKSDKYILVIGSEGNGMRRLTRESCDFLVRLPEFGRFSTLNAAQAATVSLYEIMRQRTELEFDSQKISGKYKGE